MKPLALISTIALLASVFLVLPANAQTRIITTTHNPSVYIQPQSDIFSGPGYEFPRVDYAGYLMPARIHGCLDGLDWCDITTALGRGWVPSASLTIEHNYQHYNFNQAQSWYSYPIITFMLDRYWRNHYQSRSWYQDRHHWNRVDRNRGHYRHPSHRYNRGDRNNPRDIRNPNPPRHRPGQPNQRQDRPSRSTESRNSPWRAGGVDNRGNRNNQNNGSNQDTSRPDRSGVRFQDNRSNMNRPVRPSRQEGGREARQTQ